MTPLQKIRTSFSTQLSLWVAGFVMVTSGVVIFLLTSFSEDVIREETIDTTMQALENTALRIDNTLRQSEIMTRLEKQPMRVNRSRIEGLLEENGSMASLRELLPDAQFYVTRRDSSQLDFYITGVESGYRQLVYNDKDLFVFSQPVGNRQYSLAVVCPAQNIYGRNSRMRNVILPWGIIGVLVLLYILYIIIGHHLRPLHRLADSAESIADGNLDTPIADTSHQDETGRLQNSLSMMQRKLAAYMDEMQQKQDKLSQQNKELQAAYGEAKAYEEMKAKFLHDMTDRMAAPVEQVCHNTDIICRSYSDLKKGEITRCQQEILQGTETITQLLDQLMNNNNL
jgi:methyl-accepting chemotaxis protein